MKVVVAHNYYGEFAQGGESVVFEQETAALRERGVEVETLVRTNAELERASIFNKVMAVAHFASSPSSYRVAYELFKQFQPQILHVHNYKFALTPAVFAAAKACGVKTALTLHNYRLIAPCGQLRRNNEVCEECVGRSASRALWRRGCATTLQGRILQYAFFTQTRAKVLRDVDVFIALSEFAKRKFVEAGLPKERIRVKPNMSPDPLDSSQPARAVKKSGRALFIGRLSYEKGIRFLLDAWRDAPLPLDVIGDGPEASYARAAAPPNVALLGELTHEETLSRLARAEFLVFPSLWYEGQPMTLVEASALSIPALVSKLGERAETIEQFRAGLAFESGDRNAFLAAVKQLIASPQLQSELAKGARALYDANHSPKKNVDLLLKIYEETAR